MTARRWLTEIASNIWLTESDQQEKSYTYTSYTYTTDW
jgi:hypothetical protein